MNVANLVTILRFPLLLGIVLMLYLGGSAVQLTAAALIVVLILMDTLDGVIARRRGEATLLGSALDVAADRAVEIVFWIVFAQQGLISVVIPLTFVIRGTLTDSIRAAALQQGYSTHSMMRSPVGHWIVASPVMRTGYAVVKASAFTLLAVALGLRTDGVAAWQSVWGIAVALSWLSLALCIIRGLPVLAEAQMLFRSSGLKPDPSHAEAK